MVGMEVKDNYFCHEAIEKYKLLNVQSPVKEGIVTDIEMLGKIFKSEIFNN